jgi:hypothetical protein
MTSIFATAMGADFDRLHPMLQRRFGVGLESGYACVGTGVMTSIRRGPWWTLPFLYIGKLRNILIPHVGRNVPFVIKNYPYATRTDAKRSPSCGSTASAAGRAGSTRP